MKTTPILASGWPWGHTAHRLARLLSPSMFLALLFGVMPSALAEAFPSLSSATHHLAQMPPPPTGYGAEVTAGEQYMVYVDGNNPSLLDQVRLLQPDAFPTYHQGRSVIQTGRFNSYENAQEQASTLARQGFGADVAAVPAVASRYGQSVPSAPTDSGQLPPLPIVPVPQAPAAPQTTASNDVEFGQPPAFPQAPSPGQQAAVPLGASPPAAAPSQNQAVALPTNGQAPYMVVIPAARDDLPRITSRVIQLGTPAAQVQHRQQPLGPHVAVGPFRDRGLAEQWSHFFREAGYRSSRVHYSP